jgi:hypothetical protein
MRRTLLAATAVLISAPVRGPSVASPPAPATYIAAAPRMASPAPSVATARLCPVVAPTVNERKSHGC